MIDLYRTLIKKVHPDVNPGLFNNVDMTQELNSVKNDIEQVRRLGIKWGFIEPDTSRPRNPHTSTFYENFRFANSAINVGTYVIIKKRGKFYGKRCKVVGISNITRGYKFYGGKRYQVNIDGVVYNWKFGNGVDIGLYFEKSINQTDTQGQSTRNQTHKSGIDAWNSLYERGSKVSYSEAHTIFGDLGISPNRDYTGSGIKVSCKIGRSIFITPLIKTTNKCVYVNLYGRSRRVSLKKVLQRNKIV